MSAPFSHDEWNACIKVMRAIADDPTANPDTDLLKGLVTKVYREARKERRRVSRIEGAASDRATIEATERCRNESIEPTKKLHLGSTALVLRRAINCYVCKRPYTNVDPFYHLLCPDCAASNHHWRTRRTDLSGRRALITGGRIKIGNITALKLLRDGADVIITTRFPQDAVRRLMSEPDFAEWKDRVRVVQLDLLNLPAVERFTEQLLTTEPHLDILINNAAQTIRRAPEYFAALAESEKVFALDDVAQNILSLSPMEPAPLMITPAVDFDGEPLDLRPRNSWVLNACEVDTVELLEVHLVGAFAPFMLNTRLRPLLCKSPFPHRFIVNVSAMEGQFTRKNKTVRHPHTNMAKAALNMLTRTSAADFASDAIFMNSVDTGWVTNENPHPSKHSQRAAGFVPPLDVVDGAARVYAPIISGIEGNAEFGKFFKDYTEHEW